jgi:hypothetical protein
MIKTNEEKEQKNIAFVVPKGSSYAIQRANWPKTNFGLLTTITLEVFPFRAYTPFPALLPRSPKLCQNGGLSILSSIEETKK